MQSDKTFSPAEYISHIALNQDDIRYIHLLWNTIEPNSGQINQDILNTYIEQCRNLRESGQTICITLFNDNYPDWFIHQGGFLTLTSTPAYQNYLTTVVTALSNWVDLWQPFQVIPELSDNSIGLIKETRNKIMQSNISRTQEAAYQEIHRQLGYFYHTPDGKRNYIAVLTPSHSAGDWTEALIDDSSIVSISSSSR